MAEKLKMETLDLFDENVSFIGKRFPGVIVEVVEEGRTVKKIDFELLKRELDKSIVLERQERYQTTWPEKKDASLLANAPFRGTLRPSLERSLNFEDTKNLYIEGDNLDALRLLREAYLGKVKFIYIDPPYNTGNDFVYRDDYADDADTYAQKSGQFDELNNRLVSNQETAGRFHTNWMNLIYPRLKLARDFLQQDGVICISIDDNEVTNLRKICDELFGEQNFIATFVWAAGKKNDSKYVSVSHEYIVCYAKSLATLDANHVIWRERKRGLDDIYNKYEELKREFGNDFTGISNELKKWFKSLSDDNPAKAHSHYCLVDEKGIFFADNASWPGGGGPKYPVLHPVTRKPVKIPSRGWIYSTPERMQEMIRAGKIYFGPDETYVPCIKSYLKDREFSTPYSVFYQDGRAATKRLMKLMGAAVFENPKDETIIQKLLEIVGTKDSIIMDFFSGSGTTAHSVFLANAMDGGNRRFILVQLPEATKEDSVARKNGFVDICQIGEERIRRCGAQIRNEKGLLADSLDLGFRVFRVDSSNMKDVFYNPKMVQQSFLENEVSNIKPDRTSLDLLIQCMLELGVDLSAKISKISVFEKEVFCVNDNFLVACFDAEITDEVIKRIAELKPVYAVFRDASFGNDSANINCEQLIKAISPSTELKVL